jgi:hypothetical protein
LGIALEGDGREGGAKGYTYNEMVQIFRASNYSKTDLIGFWWKPEAVSKKSNSLVFLLHYNQRLI